MKVALSKIVDNPWRNLNLYPLDREQIEKLKNSISEHGFFGGVKAREVGGKFELACGHHRIAAARAAGLTHVDIAVGAMSEDVMIRLMATENATQFGARSTAILNEVSAVMHRVGRVLLEGDNLRGISQRSKEIAKLFQSDRAAQVARGTLEKGDGLGRSMIRRYLGGGVEKKCHRSEEEIADGVALLKQSGMYGQIVISLRKEIEAACAVAEKEVQAAEREERTANTPAKKKAADSKKKKADAEHKKADAAKQRAKNSERHVKDDPEKRFDRIFDERCATIFQNAYQLTAFREAVTTKAAREVIPVDQQLPLARHIMSEIEKATEDRKRVGAPFIKSCVASVVTDAINAQRQLDTNEKRRLIEEQTLATLESEIATMAASLRSVGSAATKIAAMLRKNPHLAAHPYIIELTDKVKKAIGALEDLLATGTAGICLLEGEVAHG